MCEYSGAAKEAPNSGFHPMYFAELFGDQVWALPGPVSTSEDTAMQFLTGHESNLNVYRNPRLLRLVVLIRIFFKAILLPRQKFFVHSFTSAIPLWLARQDYVIVIHGTDHRHLDTWWGELIAAKATDIKGVGFSRSGNRFSVDHIGNVFDREKLEQASKSQDQYGVLFVLRPAPVKRPEYPIYLSQNLASEKQLRICAVGVDAGYFVETIHHAAFTEAQSIGNLHLAGRQPFEEVAGLMKSAAVLVIPSESEGVAKVMLEGFFCGMHVVVSNDLYLPEIFENLVHRVDLYDWQSLSDLFGQLHAAGRSEANAVFARSYFDDSVSQLTQMYSAHY